MNVATPPVLIRNRQHNGNRNAFDSMGTVGRPRFCKRSGTITGLKTKLLKGETKAAEAQHNYDQESTK